MEAPEAADGYAANPGHFSGILTKLSELGGNIVMALKDYPVKIMS